VKPRNRRSARRRQIHAAIIACAVVLTVSGVALASLTKTQASSPPPSPVVVVLPAPPHPAPRVSRADVRTVRPATNRAAVYQPPPPPPTVQAASTQPASPSVEAPPPPPILGQQGDAKAIAGTVRIRLKGTDTFVSLSGSAGIPNGSEVDATDGRVLITVATGHAGSTASAEVYEGIFTFHQTGGAHALARLTLSLPLTGCPRSSPPGHPHARSPAKGAGHRSGAKSRHLWVSESGGSWGTGGRYVSTTVEGTRWLTLDECDRSEVEVAAGRVKVRDLVNDKTKVISTGQTYVAAR
jgi:hypothetical protein